MYHNVQVFLFIYLLEQKNLQIWCHKICITKLKFPYILLTGTFIGNAPFKLILRNEIENCKLRRILLSIKTQMKNYFKNYFKNKFSKILYCIHPTKSNIGGDWPLKRGVPPNPPIKMKPCFLLLGPCVNISG